MWYRRLTPSLAALAAQALLRLKIKGATAAAVDCLFDAWDKDGDGHMPGPHRVHTHSVHRPRGGTADPAHHVWHRHIQYPELLLALSGRRYTTARLTNTEYGILDRSEPRTQERWPPSLQVRRLR